MGHAASVEKIESFETNPAQYRHWKLKFEGEVATLSMDVQEDGGLRPDDYVLKLNSYDLGVDVELADAISRIRFAHPEVKVLVVTSLKERIFCAGANIFMLGSSSHPWKVNFCKFTNETRLYLEDLSEHSGVKVVLLRSAKPRVFCAGANIRMLAGATHAHKVNFCKFTNETRNGIEDASETSGLATICVINGTAAGGGYELALAADHIMLIDDGSSAVVEKKSAWSRRTLRLSTTRVSPPVPGSTPSSGTSGSETAELPSSTSTISSQQSASS